MDGKTSYKATATTCDKKIDMSNYWVPSLFHIRADGLYELVPWYGSVSRPLYLSNHLSTPFILTHFF